MIDTETILNRPATVMITKTSGLAGIAYWINQHYKLIGTPDEIDKRSPMVVTIKEWVDAEYENGRQNAISTIELEHMVTNLSEGKL